MIVFKELEYTFYRSKRQRRWDRARYRYVWERKYDFDHPIVKTRGSRHLFIREEGDAWKTPCGHKRNFQSPGMTPVDLARMVEDFSIGRFGTCLKCRDWLLKHKEALLAAERLGAE